MSYSPLKQAKRLVVLVVGITILTIGVAMLVLPGPGLLVMLAGLGLLATEFVWARHLLQKVKQSSMETYRGWWNGRARD